MTTSGYVALGLVVLVLAVAVYAGGKAIVAGAAELREKQLGWVNKGSASEVGENEPASNETEAVTLCDLNMQSQAIARSAYRADWSWRIQRRAGVVAVRRGFVAVNSFGVEQRGEYTCLVGEGTSRLAGLQYEIGDLTVTVPGSELQH